MTRYTLLFCLVIALLPQSGFGQSLTERLYQSYDSYRESRLEDRRFKHRDLQPLIDALRADPDFTVQTVGYSIEGRTLQLISVGQGATDVFLWSQMHGDESTATMAIFDIFNWLRSDEFQAEKRDLLSKVRLHFLPMLNPDGAERFQRRNALGIDVNRDALRLQSPEGRTLKRIRDSLDADFGFNLHDQSRYYNAYRTEKPATISYLAPAYNYGKSINDIRKRAMQVIALMNRVIQRYAPGQVGRYSDAFEPRAFGDNIQKWGTSTILIESGGYPADREKQEIRKLNYVSMLTAIFAIADRSYTSVSLQEYRKIPSNDRKLYDLKIEGMIYPLLGSDYILDLGINRGEIDLNQHRDFYYRGYVSDQGDLSTYYGYEELDASGLRFAPGKVYPEPLENLQALQNLRIQELLRRGYTYIPVQRLDARMQVSPYPVHLVDADFTVPDLGPGEIPATFLLYRGGEVAYAVVNGFLIDLRRGPSEAAAHGLILRR